MILAIRRVCRGRIFFLNVLSTNKTETKEIELKYLESVGSFVEKPDEELKKKFEDWWKVVEEKHTAQKQQKIPKTRKGKEIKRRLDELEEAAEPKEIPHPQQQFRKEKSPAKKRARTVDEVGHMLEYKDLKDEIKEDHKEEQQAWKEIAKQIADLDSKIMKKLDQFNAKIPTENPVISELRERVTHLETTQKELLELIKVISQPKNAKSTQP